MFPTTPVPRRNIVSNVFAILELDQERRQKREMQRNEIGDLVLTRKIRPVTFDQEDSPERKRQCCQVRLSFDHCMDRHEQSPRSVASYDDENLVPSLMQEVSGLSMPALRPRRMGKDLTNLPYMPIFPSSSPAASDTLPFMPM
jgi:hypothetical protein